MNNLLTVKGGKFKFSAQENDLAPFVGNGTKVKVPPEINPPFTKGNFDSYKTGSFVTYSFGICHDGRVASKNIKI